MENLANRLNIVSQESRSKNEHKCRVVVVREESWQGFSHRMLRVRVKIPVPKRQEHWPMRLGYRARNLGTIFRMKSSRQILNHWD